VKGDPGVLRSNKRLVGVGETKSLQFPIVVHHPRSREVPQSQAVCGGMNQYELCGFIDMQWTS
jgi:hypothetical protein